VVAVAGLLNGSSVPVGIEQGRIAFYHWAWVLALFVAVVAGLVAADLVRRAIPRLASSGRATPRRAISPHRVRTALAGVAVVAIAVPSLVNPLLDRRSNNLTAANITVERAVIDEIADQVLAHRDDLGGHTVLVARNEPLYAGVAAAVAYTLTERGVDVRYPLLQRFSVADGRLVDRDEMSGALVVVIDDELPGTPPVGGELVARADVDSGDGGGLDVDAYQSLVATAQAAGEVRPSDDLARYIEDLDPEMQLFADAVLDSLIDNPGTALMNPDVLDLLSQYPVLEPAFDPDDLVRTAESLGPDYVIGTITSVRVYALDRDEALAATFTSEIGRGDQPK
jgi:hypothetical protein